MTNRRTSVASSELWTNWSGYQRCQPRQLLRPNNEEELVDAIRLARSTLRVTGAGHSFSPLVLTNETLVSLESLAGIRSVDLDRRQVTCSGGTTIHNLGEPLFQQGLSLSNQGDVDSQTLA